MNAIATKIRIDYYNDLTRSARFTFAEIAIAVNDAIQQFIDEKIGDEMSQNPENFQWTQQMRDDLSTIIKTASPTISNGAVVTTRYGSFIPSSFTTPTDYYYFVSLSTLIDGFTSYARPITYNELGPLLQDSFKMPTNKLTYYVEANGTYTVWRGPSGTFTSAGLTYLKIPNTYSCGQESQLLTTGATLTNALVYYATEVSVYVSVTYQPGDVITGTGAALTSGQVILSTNTVPIELPERVQDDICKLASVNLLKVIQLFDSSQAIQSEVSKT